MEVSSIIMSIMSIKNVGNSLISHGITTNVKPNVKSFYRVKNNMHVYNVSDKNKARKAYKSGH